MSRAICTASIFVVLVPTYLFLTASLAALAARFWPDGTRFITSGPRLIAWEIFMALCIANVFRQCLMYSSAICSKLREIAGEERG